MNKLGSKKMESKPVAILKVAAIAGTLDIVSAFIYTYIKLNMEPQAVLNFISNTALGKDAIQQDTLRLLAGLLIHYIIAWSWVSIYFFIYPRVKLAIIHPAPAAVLYGLLVWCVMNLLLLPLWNSRPLPHLNPGAITNMIILMLAIGLPSAFGARSYYRHIN